MLLSNGVLIYMCLIATMIRIYDAIRMPNVCTRKTEWLARAAAATALIWAVLGVLWAQVI